MTILTRISRLFTADVHGILDGLETPEVILKQAVRDMQAEIDLATETIIVLSKQLKRLQQSKQSLSANYEELQQQLHFCFSENNAGLAKSVIRKKLQTEYSLNEISRQITKITDDKNLISTESEERKEKLLAIQEQLALFTEQNEINVAPVVSESSSSITQDDIELAFLYEKQHYDNSIAGSENP